MNYFSHFRCIDCGAEYDRDEVRYLCPDCSKDYKPGIPLPGVLETILDYDGLRSAMSDNMDYQSFMDCFSPVDREFYPDLPVGNTPLFNPHRLSSALEMPSLWIKFDGLNPSGSLKDRASYLMVAEANRLGIKEIVCASTGNAACSLSALCAAAGLKAVIFAPAKAPVAKLTQIKIHGADLHKVDGTYDDAFAKALAYSGSDASLNRNTAYHPFTIEGKKTVGLEIYYQMKGQVPDWIVVPTGDGVILSGVHKAFLDLQRSGLITRLPKLLSVQNESSDAITKYWETGIYQDAATPDTIADSISVKTPSNAHWALKSINESKGKSIRVSDAEIRKAQSKLAQDAGVFAEPSSSATLAGLQKAISQKWINTNECVVLLVTGHGLKNINAVQF